jgi:hypothetical protein
MLNFRFGIQVNNQVENQFKSRVINQVVHPVDLFPFVIIRREQLSL